MAAGSKSGTKEDHNTHTYLMTDLTSSEPNGYKILFLAIQRSIIGWDTQDSSCTDHFVTPTVAKEILKREK